MIYQFEHEEIKRCRECPMHIRHESFNCAEECALQDCQIAYDSAPQENDCPLVAISKTETTSWTMIDSDINLWKCSKCSEEWNFEFGGPDENNMHFCPNCGRKLN